jgi:hypothetical protein
MSEDKLSLECEKLKEELRVLRRPAWKTVPGVTAILAVTATVIQFAHSRRQYDLARIEHAQVQLKTMELSRDTAALTAKRAELEEKVAEVDQQERALRTEVADLTKYVADNPHLKGANEIITMMRTRNFPLTFRGNFTDNGFKVVVTGQLALSGELKATVEVVGPGSRFASKGYRIEILDPRADSVLDTSSSGELSGRGTKHQFGIRIVRFKKAFSDTLTPSTMNRILVPSQVRIVSGT